MIMVIQESPKDSRLVIIEPMQNKLKSTILMQGQVITRASFSPTEKDVIVTTGTNHFRVWKLLDGQFKPLSQYKLN